MTPNDEKRDAGSIVSPYCSEARHQLLEEVICSVYRINLTLERSQKRGAG